ncbi:MAG: phosphodiester glycosidase family protein [Pleurocapsa sp. SU_5_0]|nr:phosphodiester glycosidase family protein [Pleurocapsa sp. SU_5_0]NJO96691.1 phosphodiester glycosidase family protein [Pleurocapsa sp. CRU_1_2]NJR45335.1 phosphodiester glycosidase family protein [Hyellaceae cyanobacterium CSU_1_1]
MKQPQKIILAFVCLGMGLSIAIKSGTAQSVANNQLSYQTIERSQYTVHTVIIPHNSGYLVSPVIAGELKPISDFAQDHLVAAINGGYFDPVNQKTTSFIVERSQIVADPRFNERLVDNPDLKQYLSKIFNRAEFRRYNCGGSTQYDIQLHSAPIPNHCTLIESLGGGPGLLPQNTSVKEGFITYQQGEKIRDAIGNDSLNARSAVGITHNEDVILAMVAQQSKQPLNSGISIPELASLMSSLGAVKAMNLDGGSSTSLYYDGRAIHGRVDQAGKKIIRPIKSVLSVIKP